MKRYLYISMICLATALLIQSCKSKKDEKQSSNSTDSLVSNSEDSVQMIHNFSSEDSGYLFKINTQQWVKNALKNSKANWDNFNYTSTIEIDTQSVSKKFTPSKDFYKNYQSILRWSLDSNFIIDFGSYGSMVVKDNNGNTHLEGGDPDIKVTLINIAKQQQLQILFGGPSMKIIDVKWLGNKEAVMLYSEESESNRSDTLLWLIDVPRNLIRQYKYH